MDPVVNEHYDSVVSAPISTTQGVKEGVAENVPPSLQKEAVATNTIAASVLSGVSSVEETKVNMAKTKEPSNESRQSFIPTIFSSITKVCKQALQMLQRLRGGAEEKPESNALKPNTSSSEAGSSHYVSAKEGGDAEVQVNSHYASAKQVGGGEEGASSHYTGIDETSSPPEGESYHYGPIEESPGQTTMNGTLDVLFDKVDQKGTISKETTAPTIEKEVPVKGKLDILGKKEVKHLNKELNLRLTDQEIKSLVKDLKVAQWGVKRGLLTTGSLGDHKFAALTLTPEGDIQAEVKRVGAGGHKVTNLAVKVGSFSPLKKDELSAISVYKGIGDPAEIENEQNLHRELHFARSAGVPLDNVVIARELKNPKTGEIRYISEFCEGGDVEGKIKNGTLTRAEKDTIALGLCMGTKQLHEAGIVHRDIKPDNILLKLDSKGRVSEAKVGDLGKSSHVKEAAGRYHTDILPINWTAPEAMGGGEALFDPKNDTYMQGVTLYQLYAGVPANQLNIKRDQFQSPNDWLRFRGNPENWKDWDKVPPDVQGLVKDMTAPSATGRRPTDAELVSFFSSRK